MYSYLDLEFNFKKFLSYFSICVLIFGITLNFNNEAKAVAVANGDTPTATDADGDDTADDALASDASLVLAEDATFESTVTFGELTNTDGTASAIGMTGGTITVTTIQAEARYGNHIRSRHFSSF
jgi:hypothetical protein